MTHTRVRLQPQRVPIRDGTFHNQSMSLAGENASLAPKFLRWDRVAQLPDAPVMVFTDMCLDEVLLSRSPTNIAILIEPAAFSTTHYEKAVRLEDHFDAIFTYDLGYLKAGVQRGAPWLYYPFGGSWIREWGVYEKLALASIIVSPKMVTEGHRLRHEIAQQFSGFVNFVKVWGALEEGQPRFEPKWKALRHYRYSIVVESARADYYFTEKLIDCLSQGTVPIYWGCPSIDSFFEGEGIIPFETLEDLAHILASISEQDYLQRLPAIWSNLELAKGVHCAEDYLVAEHPWLFEDSEAAATMRAQRREQGESHAIMESFRQR